MRLWWVGVYAGHTKWPPIEIVHMILADKISNKEISQLQLFRIKLILNEVIIRFDLDVLRF